MVCFESWKLKEHEKNYATHDLELAVIVHALKVWRNYVMGRKLKLQIDHLILKYLFNQPNLNAWQAIWIDFLCEFEFEMKHVNGKENNVEATLRRRSHMEAINTTQIDLRAKTLEAIASNEFSLQVKE